MVRPKILLMMSEKSNGVKSYLYLGFDSERLEFVVERSSISDGVCNTEIIKTSELIINGTKVEADALLLSVETLLGQN